MVTASSSLSLPANAGGRTRSVLSLESAVKKVILSHVMELSVFFGQESAMDKLLTQLLTFLNDQVCGTPV